jgi:UDP-N-acetylglucosamine enolpyruvyl transferase
VEQLHGAEHTVIPDRIETGTYAMAAAMTDGDVMLEGARADLLQEVLQTLRSTGIEIEERPSGLRVAWNGGALDPVSVETRPFPGFPTEASNESRRSSADAARALNGSPPSQHAISKTRVRKRHYVP